jgi:hypothetical protein
MPLSTDNTIDNLHGPEAVVAITHYAATAPIAPLPNNAHLHLPPNFSAFTTVQDMIDQAANQNVAVVGVSNYYDYDVYADFTRLARQRHIFPLYGLEIICLVDDLQKQGIKINDPGNPGKFYLCGKGITRYAQMTPEAQRILGIIRRNDSTRMAAVVAKLADVFQKRGVPTGLTESSVIDMIVRRHGCPRPRVYLQERHVCQAFQERFFEIVPAAARAQELSRVLGAPLKSAPDDAVGIQNEIRSHLLKSGKPAYVPETFVGFDDACKLIVELGGIPCYPTLADGANPICAFETPIESLIDHIKQRNIGFAEFIPIRNSPAVLSQYVKAMRKAGLVLTAGTEHNTLDQMPIEPTCLKGQPIPDDIKAIFWEGACVVAAHQFLTQNGQPGFTNRCGEDRIAALYRLGAGVIHHYRQDSRFSKDRP